MTMKKYMFIVVAAMLVLFGGQANAQRCLPGMRGIELRGGFTDGFGKPVDFYTGIAMSTYTKHANRWVVGAEYLQKSYGYRNMQIPRAQFTLEGGYFLKFLSDPSKTFFLSIGGSALARRLAAHDKGRLHLWRGGHAGIGELHYRPYRATRLH